jgi:hypothetical protein
MVHQKAVQMGERSAPPTAPQWDCWTGESWASMTGTQTDCWMAPHWGLETALMTVIRWVPQKALQRAPRSGRPTARLWAAQ